MFEGRRWAIEDWQGKRNSIPSNEDIGIEIVSVATNNWAWRVDHFAVVQGRLYLSRFRSTSIRVNSPDDYSASRASVTS